MILPRVRVAITWAIELSVVAAMAQPLTLAASRPAPESTVVERVMRMPVGMSGRPRARTAVPARASGAEAPAAEGTLSVAGAPHAISGKATWYAAAPDAAAAGPALRRALGRGWRGTWVVVRHEGRSVTVQLSDWCLCSRRDGVPTVIDLSDDAFRALAPLSVGVISVTVSPVVPPQTDTE